jgi:PAS domain S-box-containing protein
MKASTVLPFPPAVDLERREAPSAHEELAVRFHVWSGTLAVAVAAVSVGALGGWWFAIEPLKSVFPGFASMKPNTAFALLLTSLAVWLHRARTFSPRRDTIFKVAAGAAGFIALATSIEYLTGFNFHIDQLFFVDRAGGVSPPGRMALTTAAALMLLNAALLVANLPRRYAPAQALAAAAALVATLSGVGYFFGLRTFAGLPQYGSMAVHTAIALVLLCLAFFFARPRDGIMEAVTDAGAGGLAIRQLFPVVFVLPVLLAWLSWQGVRAGWYEPGFAIAVFVALAANMLGYAVWAGGLVLRGFEQQRAAAESERAQSEERLRRAVVDAPVPTIIHDSDGRILHMSRGWADSSGYPIDRTPTLAAWIAAARPTGAGRIEDHLGGIARQDAAIQGGEWTITAANGTPRTWELSTTPLGSIGSTRGVFVTMGVDVTERKQAEDELRRVNEGLEQRIAERTAELTRANDALKRQSDQLKEQATLLDLVRDGILVRDLFGTIIYWNEGAADMYGWNRGQALGAVSHKLLGAEYPVPVNEIERQVMQDGHWEGEVIHRTRAGAKLHVESRWTLTRTERGVPQGFLEVYRDITSRRLAQDSLQDSERRFRAVAESAIEGIITIDERGAISYWNPGAARLFGRGAAETVGQPISVALPDPALLSHSRPSTDHAQGTTFETIGRRADGIEFPVELSLSEWTTSQGARFFTGIARDITARKNAEHQLEAKADELSRSNQELEQFAYVASHDLQEPLRMVSNYTQLLGRRYKDKLDQDANEFIDFAVDGARRMQDLIRDLLEYARVGTRGKAFKPVPAETIVAAALVNLSSAIEDTGANVTTGSLPMLVCDASQITQVLQNLVGNAIKFRRPGTTPVVRITAAREDRAWRIAVSDNGIGIEPKYFDRIFQMFQRLHGRDEYAGTGIGLALCRKIIERHGGRIRVESARGSGATFSFTIPDTPEKAGASA